MSQLRFYVDEDATEHAVVDALRARGVDLLTTLEAGRTGAIDEAQLRFAVEETRCLYTLNVAHFAKIHQEFLETGRSHFGIVVIPEQRYSIGEKVRRLATLATTVSAEDMIDRMVYL